MKKSFAKIRHIQEVNKLLDKRIIKEQQANQDTPPPVAPAEQTPPTPSTGNTTTTQVKKCTEMMTNSGAPGASSSLNVNGNVTIEFKGTVSPEFQGYYVNVDSKPYCFIPIK